MRVEWPSHRWSNAGSTLQFLSFSCSSGRRKSTLTFSGTERDGRLAPQKRTRFHLAIHAAQFFGDVRDYYSPLFWLPVV